MSCPRHLPAAMMLCLFWALSCAEDKEAPIPVRPPATTEEVTPDLSRAPSAAATAAASTRSPPTMPSMSPTGTLGAVSLPEMGSCVRACAERDPAADCKKKCRETCEKHCSAQGSAFVDRCKKDCARQIVNAGDN